MFVLGREKNMVCVFGTISNTDANTDVIKTAIEPPQKTVIWPVSGKRLTIAFLFESIWEFSLYLYGQ